MNHTDIEHGLEDRVLDVGWGGEWLYTMATRKSLSFNHMLSRYKKEETLLHTITRWWQLKEMRKVLSKFKV